MKKGTFPRDVITVSLKRRYHGWNIDLPGRPRSSVLFTGVLYGVVGLVTEGLRGRVTTEPQVPQTPGSGSKGKSARLMVRGSVVYEVILRSLFSWGAPVYRLPITKGPLYHLRGRVYIVDTTKCFLRLAPFT